MSSFARFLVLTALFLSAAPAAAQTLAEALDQDSWTFTTGAESPWTGQTEQTHDGQDAGQAGFAEGGSSWLATTRSLASGGTIGFWWKVASGRSLTFLMDGASIAVKDGPSDWESFSWVVPAGNHTFRWECADVSGTAGDTGWVDQVTFAPSGTILRALSIATTDDAVAGASMTASPADANGRVEAQTPVALAYAEGTPVEVEAPFQGPKETGFGGWFGCDGVTGRRCTVALGADRAVTGWYLPNPTELLWEDRVAGTAFADDKAGGIARGPDGTIWVAGTLYQRGRRGKPTAHAWLGRYAEDGSRLWQTTFPGEGGDVAVAPDGSVFMTGAMSKQLFIRKYSPTGVELWTKTRPGVGKGVAVSPDGAAVYVTGTAAGDLILLRYSAFGELSWTRMHNGSANRADEGRRVAVASDGGVFVVGAARRAQKGQSAWVRKYSPGGEVLWTYTEDGDGAADDWASGLTLHDGRLYVAGSVVLFVEATGSLHRHHWMAAFTEAGAQVWSFKRSCDPLGSWNFEVLGVAVSPLGTIDYVGREYRGHESVPLLFRLNPDGSPVDSTTQSFYFFGGGRMKGIVAGDDSCYLVSEGFANSAADPPTKSDISVGKYSAVPPPAP